MLSKCARSASFLTKVQTARFSGAVPKVKNFINGKFEDSKTTEWINLYNPATGELIFQVPQSTPEELKRAEEGAKEAFKTWKEVPVQQRQVRVWILSW
jgi:malonate-semialdehyde dehydrogenase (acetylating)/methylmalonate-semialdehyde dehydrogenase